MHPAGRQGNRLEEARRLAQEEGTLPPRHRHVLPDAGLEHPRDRHGRGLAQDERGRFVQPADGRNRPGQLGIHSAMSAFEAKRLAPNGIFLSPNFTKYKVVSAQIHDIFRRFTNKVEPVAFDEAYLDVTANVLSGATLAAEIRHQILKETHLTSSIGVSHNKLLAKLGSEYNKPNGVTVINVKINCNF